MKKIAINIYGLTVGMISFLMMMGISLIMNCLGKATKYTNLIDVKTGKKLSFTEFLMRFSYQHEAMGFNTDQGKLAIVHGVANGLYFINGKMVDEDVVADSYNAGEWALASCCNGLHRDFELNGRSFKRVNHTNTRFETMIAYYPWGDVILFGGKMVAIYVSIITFDFGRIIDVIKA